MSRKFSGNFLKIFQISMVPMVFKSIAFHKVFRRVDQKIHEFPVFAASNIIPAIHGELYISRIFLDIILCPDDFLANLLENLLEKLLPRRFPNPVRDPVDGI